MTTTDVRQLPSPTRIPARAVQLILAVALAVRFIGLLWGGYNPDENISMSAKVLAGQIIPDYHYYPPFLNYLAAGSFAIVFLIGRLLAVWWSLADFRRTYFENPALFYLAARSVTAIAGSLASVVGTYLGASVGLKRGYCYALGVLLALMPVDVLNSHVSKGDTGAATAVLAAALCAVYAIRDPDSRRAKLLLTATIALAASFKHSTAFTLAPLIAYVGYDWVRFGGIPLLRAVRTVVYIGLSSIAVWGVLNIGAVLEFREFIRFQKVQSLMSFGADSALGTAWRGVLMMARTSTGAGPILIVAWLFAPLISRRRLELMLFVTPLAGFAAIAFIGGRLEPHLLLPISLLIVASGAIAAARYAETAIPSARQFAGAALFAAALTFATGTLVVLWEALRPPLSVQVAAILRPLGGPADLKILAAEPNNVGLPISAAGPGEETSRDQRLASKYGVVLPARAKERSDLAAPAGVGYFVQRIPYAIGGLEKYDESQVTTVLPFAWPVQRDEFDLDYWLAKGFNTFVVENESGFLDSSVAAYSRFHRQITERCELVAGIPCGKSLFMLGDARVYRLRERQAGLPATSAPPAP